MKPTTVRRIDRSDEVRLAVVTDQRNAAEVYEVLALRYGRLRAAWNDLYVAGDDSSRTLGRTELAYYFWLARNDRRVVLIDTGFDVAVGTRRGRETLVPPLELLAAAGVAPEQVTDIVLTHFHYDHIGNVAAFGNARVYAADAEYAYWVRREAVEGETAPVEPAELAELARLHDAGRLTLLPPHDVEIVGGICALPLPGHTPGQLAVRIPTAGPDVVLTSDAAHSAEEIERDLPFRVHTDLPAMRASMAAVRRLGERNDAILVLGHEPSVAERFPRWHDVDGVFRLSA